MASTRPDDLERRIQHNPRQSCWPHELGGRPVWKGGVVGDWRWLAAWVLALMATAVVPGAVLAQNQNNAQAKESDQEASIHLDILQLLTSDIVFQSTAEDGIWSISPGAGRRLIQIPLDIKPGKKDTDFGSSTVRVGGTRFLAWRVVEPVTQTAESGSDAARNIQSGMQDLPTFTRNFTLTANGRIDWKMDRFILGGSVKQVNLADGTSQRLYALRISPQTLAQAAPHPPKITRGQGEDTATYYGRSAVANSEYRVARKQYSALRKTVNALPDKFDRAAPSRVWSVYDMRLFETDLKLTGTDEKPWTIPLSVLKTLREACHPNLRANDDGGPKIAPQYLAAMVTLGKDKHPYSQRVVAYTLSLSGAVASVTFNDPLYRLLQNILSGDDAPSRRIVIKELATVMPPSAATLTLLKNVAASDLDPRSRMETLRGMLNTDFSPTSPQTRDAINSINRSLGNPDGPSPADILKQVLESSKDKPQAVEMLSGGVRFGSLPDQRLEQAIIFVVENAGTNTLASNWLDRQLLGAVNPKIVLQTFEVIAAADTGGKTLSPAVNSVISALFGKPKTAAVKGHQGPKVAHIGSPIKVPGTNHGLFRALRSSDSKIRQLAWQALPNFVFNKIKTDHDENDLKQPVRSNAQNARPSRYTALLDLALQQPSTPPVVVTFFAKQPDRAKAATVLVQLVLRGSSETSALASRSLLAMRVPLTEVVNRLPFGERAGLATRLYENTLGRAPLTVSLLRQRSQDNPLVTWFGQEISKGVLPTAPSWAQAVNNEATLIGLINSSDPDVGLAATAALVYQAGGSDHDAQSLARRFRSLPDQSLTNMTTEWNKAKAKLYINQFQAISGPYKLILKSGNTQQVLAVVQFQTDGTSISFGNQAVTLSIPDDHLAIRINQPAELKTLSTLPELTNLDLDQLPAVELTRQPNGDWTAPLPVPGVNPTPDLIMRSVLGR